MVATIPPALEPARPYRIALVCLGNICRSPMAAVVLEKRVGEAGLGALVEVRSSGTGSWHMGDPMDRRAAATLETAGYDPTRHRARQLPPAWFGECDLLLAMDGDNLADMLAWPRPASPSPEARPTAAAGPTSREDPEGERIRRYREFDPVAPGSDVPDPYYGGQDGFEEVLAIVERTTEVLVQQLRARLSGQHGEDRP